MDINWIKYNFVEDVLDAQSYQTIYIENIKTLEKSGYKLMKLSSVCKSIYRGNTPEHIEGIIPKGALLLKTTNIRSNELDLSKIFCMEEEVYINEGRFKLNENDICITIMGATNDIVGRSWVYSNNIGPACFSDGIAKIEDVRIDSSFLSTYINSRYGHLSIIQWSGSSTRSYITNKQLGDIKIPIPSPKIQEYIGNKVRRAEELREEAKKLKEEAEVVFAKEINLNEIISKNNDKDKFYWKDIKNLEQRIDMKYNAIDIEIINNHFSKHKTIRLEDSFKLISGYSFSSELFNNHGKSKIIKIGDLKAHGININDLERIDVSNINSNINKFLCENGDILYAMTGATIGNSSMFIEGNDKIDAYINQRVLCIKQKKDIPTGYLLVILNSYIGKTISFCLSTGVAQPNISLEDLKDVKIPIIDEEKVKQIHENIIASITNINLAKQIIQEAKQDVEDLIEGNFDMSKLSVTTPESR